MRNPWRSPLDVYREALKDVQSGCCFYCRKTIRGPGQVDHFIPWTRYPVDLGHNFVLADSTCNHAKLDHLAAARHIEAWRRRNADQGETLRQWFEEQGVVHDLKATMRVAHWAYAQAEAAQSSVWLLAGDFEALPPSWRDMLKCA